MVDQAEIHKKAASGKVEERREAVSLLRDNFADLPNKEHAWEDLHRLAGDEDRNVQRRAVRAFGTAFHNIPDKERAWEDLHRLTVNGSSFVRWHVAYALGRAFPHIPDKEHAWEDLIRLMQDWNEGMRSGVAGAICTAFQHVPNKELSWRDLHRLTLNERVFVRLRAAYVLGRVFPHIPDKKQAWEDLHRLIWDEDHYVRQRATDALGFAFQQVPNKKQAWKDIIRLMQDKDRDVRQRATDALGFAFQHVSDKKQGWKDIIWLMQDRDEDVRRRVKTMLGTVFYSILDMEQAWKDLIELMQNKNIKVRRGAVYILGIAFPHVTDKEQVWEDLYRLTKDKDKVVQISVNHYLGRLSIVRATEAESEESFRNELQEALRFFEEASRGGILFDNPSSFCLPFYRSFYAITSEKEKAEDEVKKYLAEAKSASENSKSKEILIEAVENLAKALSEAQSPKETKLDAIQYNLNTYRQYCDRAADLIGEAAEDAPGAARVLRRGLPIIDQRIKELLEEIKTESESICKAADLPESEIGCRIGQHVATALTALATDNPLFVEREIDLILNDLERWSHSIRDENEKGYVQDLIFDAKNGDTRGKTSSIRVLVGRLLTFSEDRGEEMSKYDIRGSVIQIAEGNGNVQEMDSSVNSRKVETESGDVTITHGAAVTEEAPPEKHRIDQQKRTAIEIFADVAVHVLVYTVLHYFAEDLMPIIAPILVLSALVILLLIIRNAKSR